MGTHKKEANRKERQGKTGDGMANVKVKGENFYRNAKKIKTLNMFKDGKAQRNAAGEITKAASYQSRDRPIARVEPNRKWFNATRVISQDALESFRSAVQAQASDPTTYLMKRNKLPMSLIEEKPNVNGLKQHAAKIAVESQSFGDTFGPKAQRKRVKLDVSSVDDLAGRTGKMHDTYLERLEQAKLLSGTSGDADQGDAEQDGTLTTARESIFSKGQSKRIWNELYKVIDSSDVILHVLDARDPVGTRCRSVERYLREEAPHKHLVFVLNKVDLVPSKVAAAWVRHLSTQFPTLAFHASINNSFGKGSLIALLRQFSSLHSDRKQISVGLVGYPNTGKSSIINTLRKKKVCNVAPIAGETKVWQYVTLMKRIYLIDCPGIVPPNQSDSDESLLLRGSIRVENVEYPAQYVDAVLKRVQPKHMQRTYEIKVDEHMDANTFLELLARKQGRLLKGGEPDFDGCAKIVLNDWIRGKIPWFTPPPMKDGKGGGASGPVREGREGQLGEMSRKRKRDDETESPQNVGARPTRAPASAGGDAESNPGDGDEFEGFSEDEGGLEVNVEDGSTGSEGGDASMLVAGSISSDDEEGVEEEVLNISKALRAAKGA
ncbi:NGP1NT-domain-containing protein [Westerdykella ornata]|uniref:Nucleolar GTP-binding protein 2 n=1 Tax=Westerdykella ornata TaxID=318751 RepID=A0A6A6JH90_WESOR|nr:NGP1NT-domain-containing protein [Westerdykella ornata]KAF2275772.1 NGP1NT-domain-containing protein [Westerdykella ornata]